MGDPQKILIIQLSALGDVLRATPLLSALKKHRPGASVDFLVDESCRDAVAENPAIDRIHTVQRKVMKHLIKGGSPWGEIFEEYLYEQVIEMRRTRYDWVINLHFSEWSGLLAFLARPSGKLSGVSVDERGRFRVRGEIPFRIYSTVYSGNRPIRIVNRKNLIDMFLELVPGTGRPFDYFPMTWTITEKERENALEYLAQFGYSLGEPLAGIQPGAGWPGKTWLPDHFAPLADAIAREFGMALFLNGAPAEREILSSLADRMTTRAIPPHPSLRINAAVISLCSFLITGDTGPMHLSAALGVPVIALFGPTSFYESGPYGEGHVILNAKIPCSPCFSPCLDRSCMKLIKPDHVLEAVRWCLFSKSPTYSDEVGYFQTLFAKDLGIIAQPLEVNIPLASRDGEGRRPSSPLS